MRRCSRATLRTATRTGARIHMQAKVSTLVLAPCLPLVSQSNTIGESTPSALPVTRSRRSSSTIRAKLTRSFRMAPISMQKSLLSTYGDGGGIGLLAILAHLAAFLLGGALSILRVLFLASYSMGRWNITHSDREHIFFFPSPRLNFAACQREFPSLSSSENATMQQPPRKHVTS